MKVKVTFNKAVLQRISDAAKAAAVDTMEQLCTDLTMNAKTMPFDLGDMQNDQTFVAVDGEDIINGVETYLVSLVTGSPQARRLYYHPEYNFQRGENSDAGAYWLEPYISGNKKNFIRDKYTELFRRRAGL